MKSEWERSVMYDDEMVTNWCKDAGDNNPLHLDPIVAEESLFGQRVVPGMMVLDEVSGMLTEMAEEGETVILAGITAARFRDPMLLDEQIDIRLTVDEETKQFTAVEMEVRAPERGSLTATGVVNVVVK